MEPNEETKPVSASTLPKVSIPAFYVNGFTVGYSASETNIIMILNGQPFQQVNMSFSAAKSLMEFIKKTLEDYESKTQQQILSIEDIQKRIAPDIENKS